MAGSEGGGEGRGGGLGLAGCRAGLYLKGVGAAEGVRQAMLRRDDRDARSL